MTRTNISLPLELKEKAKRNGKHRGIKALSTYIQYLIEADDHLIQDAKRTVIDLESDLNQRLRRQA
jgi:predicted DNA-binding protein